MEKKQICPIFLFQFKLGWKAAETAHDINEAQEPLLNAQPITDINTLVLHWQKCIDSDGAYFNQ